MQDPIKLRNRGILFGYPDCCIDAAVERGAVKTRPKDIWSGTGFGPCDQCLKEDPLIIVQQIAARRRYPFPFPITLNKSNNLDLVDNLDPNMVSIIEQVYEFDLDEASMKPGEHSEANFVRMRNNQRLALITNIIAGFIDLPFSELSELAITIKTKYENNGFYSKGGILNLKDYTYKEAISYLDQGGGLNKKP